MQLEPIKDTEYLQKLINDGYNIDGPRHNMVRDMAAVRAFLRKGRVFSPEEWLTSQGYQFIEPNTFTKGFRIAYKLIDGFPDELFRSNYSLFKKTSEVPLYLKVEVKEAKE
jgi:hypothetical protein